VLDAAIGIAAEIDGVIDVDADLAPDLVRSVDRIRRELVPSAVESGDVVRVRRAEDLTEAVAVHVGDGDVLVVHPPPVAGLAVAPRGPPRTHRAVGLVDAELLRAPTARAPHDDLELAVVLEVGDCECAHLAAPERVAGPQDAAKAVVDGELVAAAAHDDLGRAVAREVGDGDARPDALPVRGPPFERARRPVQRDNIVGAPHHLGLAVAVDVGDRGRGVPAGLAVRPGDAASVSPLEDRRGDSRVNQVDPRRHRDGDEEDDDPCPGWLHARTRIRSVTAVPCASPHGSKSL
jgi:hypothetical protein